MKLPTLFSGIIGYQNTGARFYDALKDTGRRRRNPPYKVRHSDNKLRDRDRRQLSAKTAEVFDNFAIAAWMVRKYLDFVAALNFRATTDNDLINRRMEEFMDNWSSRFECHTQRKHYLPTLIRLIEGRRVLDGDVFIVKVGGRTELRGSLQVLEADRIATPVDREQRGGYDLPSQGSLQTPTNRRDSRLLDDFNAAEWVNGIRLSKNGIARSYAVHRRSMDGSLQYERTVQAENVVHHGIFDRIDQIRGITPFTPAINMLADIMEGADYTIGKMKLQQLMGAFITREGDVGLGAVPKHDKNRDGVADSNFEFDFSDGVNVFDLNPGESVMTLQDRTVQSDTVEFLQLMITLSLKALDLPFSFFSEDFTNWYGSRGAQILFNKSVKVKQRELGDALNEITRWRLGMAIVDGELQIPRSMDFKKLTWQWTPEATELWDPVKEIQGYKAGIAAGFYSPQQIVKKLGGDWVTVFEERKEAEAFAEELGIALDYSMNTTSNKSVQAMPEDAPGTEPELEAEEEETNADADTEQGGDEE